MAVVKCFPGFLIEDIQDPGSSVWAPDMALSSYVACNLDIRIEA